MRRRSFLLALAAGACLGSAPALAQSQQDFSLVNRTMPPGPRRNITFGRTQRECLFDIRIIYSDGERAEIREVDLCRVSVVTLTWNGGTRYRVD